MVKFGYGEWEINPLIRVFLKNRLITPFTIVFIRNTLAMNKGIIITSTKESFMWEVIAGFCGEHRKFCVVNDDLDFYELEGKIYHTPYRIEAQQIADELNGEKK